MIYKIRPLFTKKSVDRVDQFDIITPHTQTESKIMSDANYQIQQLIKRMNALETDLDLQLRTVKMLTDDVIQNKNDSRKLTNDLRLLASSLNPLGRKPTNNYGPN